MTPVVSVIIPVYNGAKYLAECLESVFGQTWQYREVIVVDDGSTDSSLEVCRRFPSIRLIRQENRGQSAARNRGVHEAKGEYIAFLDQDDKWYPGKLARQVPILASGNYGMVYSNVDRIDEEGRIVERNFLDRVSVHPKKSLVDCLRRDMFILPGASLIRKDLFDEVGGFDERLSGYEDDDLFLRVFQRSRMFYIPEALMQWRIYPTSYSYTERMERSRQIYLRKLLEMFPDRPDVVYMNMSYPRDAIIPRFLHMYLLLYLQSLQFSSGQATPEVFRTQLSRLLRHKRSLILSMLTKIPVPIARQMYKIWCGTPMWWRRPLLGLVGESIFGQYGPDVGSGTNVTEGASSYHI